MNVRNAVSSATGSRQAGITRGASAISRGDVRAKTRAARWFSILLWLGWVLVGVAHAGTVTYVYTDPQGTPLAEADASGNIIATYDYTPYGSQALGTAPNGPGYTGHVNDPDTGLVYMQARYYDPAVGRFISTDPAGLSAGNTFNFSRYTYADNNPVVNIDPDGRMVNQDQETSPGGCTGSLTGGGCGSLHLSITQVASPSVTEQKKSNAQQAQQTTSNSSAKKTLTQAMKDYVRSGELTQNIIVGSLGAITTMQGGDEDDPIPGEEAEQAVAQQTALAPVGRLGSPMDVPRGTNGPGNVEGVEYSGHAFDQMQGRGLTPSVIKNTIGNGATMPGRNGATIHYDAVNNTTVITNSSGRVITTYPGGG